MKTGSIPLPKAVLGTEYTIDRIENGITQKIFLKGYGIIPGTKIKLLFKNPSNDPCAYEIMGAVLALRNKEAENIYIFPTET